MRYDYRNPRTGEVFEIEKPMSEATREEFDPVSGEQLQRVFVPLADVWNCDGSYKHDYFRGGSEKQNAHAGDKSSYLQKLWKDTYNEEPPPPAPDVARNGSDPT